MPKSKITITPITNIKDNIVQNVNLVYTEEHDSLMDVFTFENKDGVQRRSNLTDVSLYDDLIVRSSTKFKILNMSTK